MWQGLQGKGISPFPKRSVGMEAKAGTPKSLFFAEQKAARKIRPVKAHYAQALTQPFLGFVINPKQKNTKLKIELNKVYHKKHIFSIFINKNLQF